MKQNACIKDGWIMKGFVVRTLAAAAAAALCFGCAATAPVKEEALVVWPPPPSKPRLQWVATVYSEDGFPKTERQKMVEKLTGKTSSIALKKPFGIVSDGEGRVYVGDVDAHHVLVFDYNRAEVGYLSSQSIFGLAAGMALDAQGRIYVADAGRSTVMVFSPDRRHLFSFGGPGLFEKPGFVAVNDRLGRIYVSDGKGSKLVAMDMQGNHLFDFGGADAGAGATFSPQGIAIDRDDSVFVADALNARIAVYDADGNFLRDFGQRGDRLDQFESPRGLAFDSDRNLYVVDGRKAALLVYDAEGKLLMPLGGQVTSHPLGFSLPVSVFVDKKDRVYITDQFNKRFTVWQYLSEAYLREHPLDPEQLRALELRVKEKVRKQ